jgi:hypothetical protein
MVVIGIYGKFAKTFILVVANGLEASDKSFFFNPEFYLQYVQLVNMYNICIPTTLLVKNIRSVVFGV